MFDFLFVSTDVVSYESNKKDAVWNEQTLNRDERMLAVPSCAIASTLTAYAKVA